MAQEGNLKTYPVRGIERNGSYSLQESGACNEVIGMELKDGCLVPFEPLRTKADISGYDDVWVHKTTKQNNYIYRNGRELTWQSEDDALAGKKNQQQLTTLPDDCNRIDFINNILCYCRTMHLFKDGAYSTGASSLDLGLKMSVGTIGNGIAVLVDKYQKGDKNKDFKMENFVNDVKGINYKQRISDNFKILSGGVRKGEYINGACLMRYAVRLADGSYVNISEPVFCTSDPYKTVRADGTMIDYTDDSGSVLRGRGTGDDDTKFRGGTISFNSSVQNQLMKSAFYWEQQAYRSTEGLSDFKGNCGDKVKECIGDIYDFVKERRDKGDYKSLDERPVLCRSANIYWKTMRNFAFSAKYQLPDYDYWRLSAGTVGFREVYQFNSKKFEPKNYYNFDRSSGELTYDYQKRGYYNEAIEKDISKVNAACDITWDSYPAQVAPLICGGRAPATVYRSGYRAYVEAMICNVYQNCQNSDIENIWDQDECQPLSNADKVNMSGMYASEGNAPHNLNWFTKWDRGTSNMHHGELGVVVWNLNDLDGDDKVHELNLYTVLSRECDTPAFIIHKTPDDAVLDMVQSIDIFMTQIVDCHEDYTNDDILTMASHRPYRKQDDVVRELTDLAGTYYKIHSISVEELKALKKNRLIIPYIERGKISALEQQETLSDYGQDCYDYKTSYVYNGKLHIANITQIISHGFEFYASGLGAHYQAEQKDGYDLATFTSINRCGKITALINGRRDKINVALQNAGLASSRYTIYGVQDDTQDKYKLVGTVRIEDDAFGIQETVAWQRDVAFVFGRLAMSSFVYPSANATNFTIKGLEVQTDSGVFFFEINNGYSLTQNKTSNISYYIGEPIEFDNFDRYSVKREDKAGEEYEKLGGGKETTVERDGNVFKVSKTNSPLVFPYEQTYMVGFGKILAFSSNAVALSQGQFGSYPLVIFTTEGIFAMQVDTSGTGCYLNNAPLSREVCNNPDAIAQTDTGIYFSTEKGLMLLSGSDTQLASENINGQPEPLPNLSDKYERGDGLKVYGNAITHTQLVQLSGAISQEDFRAYLSASGTRLSYIYVKSKLICYNSKYKYCYLIDTDTHVCTKLNKCVKFDTKNYPSSLYAIVDGYSWHEEAVTETTKVGRIKKSTNASTGRK